MALFWRQAMGSLRDLLPIVIVIVLFQVLVLQRPLTELLLLAEGTILVVLGLTLFIYGLELALFPVGDALAHALARKGSVRWLVIFAFALGFGTTIAEPALIAIAAEAANMAVASGMIDDSESSRDAYALALRLTVGCAVGVALILGVARIIMDWSLPGLIISGYVIVVLMTFVAPAEITGIAYDSGAVTTSTVTVPLVAALGIGLASSLGDRNPMTDGFGLIAFASLVPIVFVMAFGMVISWT